MNNRKKISPERIDREKQTIQSMLAIYCTKHHQSSNSLCDSCTQLLLYAFKRLDNCPFKENKPACNHCQVHCYSDSMRQKIKKVMRYAGPKMLLRHPRLSFYHILDTFRKVPSIRVPAGKKENNG